METDAERVLESLAPVEREVRGALDRFFLARMLPYRTVDDRIAGVVLTFVDITDRQRAERVVAEDLQNTERLRKVSERLVNEADMGDLFKEIIVAAMALTRADSGSIQLLNPATERLELLAANGFPDGMTEQLADVEAAPGTPAAIALATGKRTILDFASATDPAGTGPNRIFREAGFASAQSTPLVSRAGRPIGMLSTHWRRQHRPTDREMGFLDLLARQAADLIDRKQAEDALREQMTELTRFNEAAMGREMRMIELKKEINALCQKLGEPARYPLDLGAAPDQTTPGP